MQPAILAGIIVLGSLQTLNLYHNSIAEAHILFLYILGAGQPDGICCKPTSSYRKLFDRYLTEFDK